MPGGHVRGGGRRQNCISLGTLTAAHAAHAASLHHIALEIFVLFAAICALTSHPITLRASALPSSTKVVNEDERVMVRWSHTHFASPPLLCRQHPILLPLVGGAPEILPSHTGKESLTSFGQCHLKRKRFHHFLQHVAFSE